MWIVKIRVSTWHDILTCQAICRHEDQRIILLIIFVQLVYNLWLANALITNAYMGLI